MSRLKDLTGTRFGRLVVIERANDYISPSGRKVVRWKCRCDCGNCIEVSVVHLRQGDTVSCGCFGKQRRAEGKLEKSHGCSRTRIYHLFQNMKYRCQNPNASNYTTYGGRDIRVCDEWAGPRGFELFYEWAIRSGYSDDLTLDRIDVDGDYTPENCRWADSETQHNNTQNSVKLTYDGKTMTAAQWAREIGVDRHTIYDRLKAGKPIAEVLKPKRM